MTAYELTTYKRELFEERAAILEFEAGMSRGLAEWAANDQMRAKANKVLGGK